MNSNVLIKSFSNGLKVFLDPECSFLELSKEVKDKFEESKGFFKGAKTAISFEGRKLSFEEEKTLTGIIEQAGGLSVLCIVGKDEETSQNFIKVVDRPIPKVVDDSLYGKFYYGTLRKNSKIVSNDSVIVVGDVEPGASITAKGNIVVIGGLYGTAVISEYDESKKYFIAAMDVNAEKILIGDYRYFSKEKPKWVVKPKMTAKMFYVDNNQVCLDVIGKDVLQRFKDI